MYGPPHNGAFRDVRRGAQKSRTSEVWLKNATLRFSSLKWRDGLSKSVTREASRSIPTAFDAFVNTFVGLAPAYS